jgi:uracil-DNA glycosylase
MTLDQLNNEIISCRKCPRLVQWREEVARVKRKAYKDDEYWGKPVPGFGDPQARVLVVGLAPGAHGSNETTIHRRRFRRVSFPALPCRL